MALSCTYTVPACNWWAFGILHLNGVCFFWYQRLVKCPNLWQALHWNFLAGHWNPSTWVESPHFEHLSLFLCAFLGSMLFLLQLDAWGFSLTTFLWLGCFGLTKDFLFLCYPDEISVHWCLIKLIYPASGSPGTCLIWCAVALELSIFFASCLTFLAGNFSRSTLLSFMVLDTNSSSYKKKQKMLWCKILPVSGDI